MEPREKDGLGVFVGLLEYVDAVLFGRARKVVALGGEGGDPDLIVQFMLLEHLEIC